MEVEFGLGFMKMVMMMISTAIVVMFMITSIYRSLAMKPKRERSFLTKQGINGPPPKILLGNLLQIKNAVADARVHPSSNIVTHHNCASSILPFLHHWTKQYGEVFVFSLGMKTVLHVSQPDLLKEITTNTSMDIGRPLFLGQEFGPLFGQGIIASNGALWARQKQLLSPHLYLDKVKGMMNLITDSSVALVNTWKCKIKSEEHRAVDMEIDEDLSAFSGDVISKACFGSSYSQNEDIFLKIRRLEEITSDNNMFAAIGIPGMRYIPTKKNKEASALEKEVHRLILALVEERKAAAAAAGGCETKKDLLQMLVESAESSTDLGRNAKDKFIVDNCKNIYLAGFETTAVSASWILMLLASNKEWQARVRSEVLGVCQGQVPTSSMLLQMKELTMVIQEASRLYAQMPAMAREALADMKIGDIYVPKGVQIWSHVHTLHTDPQIWGPDSLEFNPQRFANGVRGACKFPHLYMPFGAGTRVCIGQHLAMAGLKAVISLIVANFSFSVSPKYVHSPIQKQVLTPEYGVKLVLEEL